ncbi:MAG TPA: hypothetical protein VMB52_03960 [Verrucomicrobiae bacterium]|nr:hypothetical protein [Verrucomicrobiae bacterium]
MTIAAVRPYDYTQADIINMSGASRFAVTNHKNQAIARGWLDHISDPQDPERGKLLYATDRFYNDRTKIALAVATDVPPTVRTAYLTGSTAFAEDVHDSDMGKPHDPEQRSSWLEMLVNIGRYDLAEHGPWKSAHEGWDLLLKTSIGTAALVSFGSADTPV